MAGSSDAQAVVVEVVAGCGAAAGLLAWLLMCTAAPQPNDARLSNAKDREITGSVVELNARRVAAAPVPSSVDPAAPRTIKGTVVDLTTGRPMSVAVVVVVGTSTVVFSEPDGTFVISDVAAGPATLSIESPEYETRVVELPAKVDSISVSLAPAKHEQIVTHCALPTIRHD